MKRQGGVVVTLGFGSSFRYLASGLLGLFALVASVSCSKTCEDIGCAYTTTLNGSANFVTEPVVVDLTVCVDHECHSGSFDLKTLDASTPCLTGSPGVEICLVTGEANRFELQFVGAIYQGSSQRPSTVEIDLVAHQSGAVLLNESRTPTYGSYTVGNCEYQCWSAEATL